MPTFETLALFSVAVLALLAIPGPNHIYIATRSATQGRSAGIASALGVETGTLVHLTAATVGLSALIASSAVAFEVVRYLGAAYLVVLGVRALRARDGSEADAPAPASLGRIYRAGVLVNVLNPKVALFFLAFLPQFLDAGRGAIASQTLVLGAVLLALGVVSDFAYVFVAAAVGGRLKRERPGGRAWLTGGIYVSLGAAAALTGGRH